MRWLGVCLLYSTIMIPYQVSFDIDPRDGVLALDWVVDIFFWADIVLNFRLGYHRHHDDSGGDDDVSGPNQIVMAWRPIAKRYIRSWFLIDFVAVFPFTQILEGALFDSRDTTRKHDAIT